MGADVRGLILFAAILLPNLIWFTLPAPNDILRGESQTVLLDGFASAFQVLTVFFMCAFIRKNAPKKILIPAAVTISLFVLLYYMAWIVYYRGFIQSAILMILAVAPCAVLIIFSGVRKNAFALIPAVVFAVCHVSSALINFML